MTVLSEKERTELFGSETRYAKEIAPGHYIGVTRMIFTMRVWVGDATGIWRAYCYPWTPEGAIAAARHWDGEGDPPDGWIKEVGTERRRIDGDPAREYDANKNPMAEGV